MPPVRSEACRLSTVASTNENGTGSGGADGPPEPDDEPPQPVIAEASRTGPASSLNLNMALISVRMPYRRSVCAGGGWIAPYLNGGGPQWGHVRERRVTVKAEIVPVLLHSFSAGR